MVQLFDVSVTNIAFFACGVPLLSFDYKGKTLSE
jgi:hypothetical protein